MSLTRAILSILQAGANHLACTPPNPTLARQRYHTEQWWLLKIAPFIFRVHMTILWICALFESLLYASSIGSFHLPLVCPTSTSSTIRTTPLFLIGSLSILLGTYIRLDCFRTLGELFTFDLTVHPQHRLVTKRFYGYVRHPAYTGSLLLVAGIAFAHLSDGAWLTECGPLRTIPGLSILVWALWWAWTLTVGVNRAKAEDKQMRKLFPDEWDKYAVAVPWWFFPGVL
ncbi:hypothetical protein F5887DRAFT_1135998 [Amanita rubescens]|nr:hypothetical protein F5887DRAFT_1135998 [Amanita rubescens]